MTQINGHAKLENEITHKHEADARLPTPPDPDQDPAGYLRSIQAVRACSKPVFKLAKENRLGHFDVDWSKFDDVAAYVADTINLSYKANYAAIPPHGRWQHFNVGEVDRVESLLALLSKASTERARSLIDLFLVSVLLDAGAGAAWSYTPADSSQSISRSEGLAVASLDMFKAGLFSSSPSNPYQVDALGLSRMTKDAMMKGLQISPHNPMDGLEGRMDLINKLATALQNSTYFGDGTEVANRPGNIINYLLHHKTTIQASKVSVALPVFWDALMDGLAPIWPATRTTIDGKSLGDAWPLSCLPSEPPWKSIVPFHKLTQWLTYSLMVPMQKLCNIEFRGADLLTGLPEYRNGGLLVDLGLLTLKENDLQRGLLQQQQNRQDMSNGEPNSNVEKSCPLFSPDDDVIVEWRSLTLGFLDALLPDVNARLGLTGTDSELNLAQMLEAGTWKGGRRIAASLRPATKGPPIEIKSDGTVF